MEKPGRAIFSGGRRTHMATNFRGSSARARFPFLLGNLGGAGIIRSGAFPFGQCLFGGLRFCAEVTKRIRITAPFGHEAFDGGIGLTRLLEAESEGSSSGFGLGFGLFFKLQVLSVLFSSVRVVARSGLSIMHDPGGQELLRRRIRSKLV